MARRNKMRLSALGDKPPQRGGPPSSGRDPRRSGGKGRPPPNFSPFADDDADRLETAGFIIGSVLLLLALSVVAAFFGMRKIEDDIEARVLAFLQANAILAVEVEASGLDLTMTGSVDRESLLTNLPDAVRSGFPVRGLEVDLRFVPPQEANEIIVDSEPLDFVWSGDTVTVTGTMSNSSTLNAVLNSLDTKFGTVNSEGLSVVEGVSSEADWLTAMILLVTEMADEVTDGQIVVNPNGQVVQFAAQFDTRQERADVRSQAEDILAGSTFDFSSSLTLTTTAPTTTSAPEVVEQVQKQFDDTITGNSVEFEFSSAVLTADGRALLDQLLVTMLEFPEVPIEVAGHTDDVGNDESNLELSRRRAESVVAYLVQNGVEAARFVVIGYGESQPIADNETDEGRAQNRRIVFTALAE